MGLRRPPFSEGSTQLQWKGESTEESAYCLCNCGVWYCVRLSFSLVCRATDTARRAAYKYGKAVPRAAHPLGAYPEPRAPVAMRETQQSLKTALKHHLFSGNYQRGIVGARAGLLSAVLTGRFQHLTI